MITIIEGKAYEALEEDYLGGEIQRREDEIVRFEEALAVLRVDLDTMKYKKVEQAVQIADKLEAKPTLDPIK